MLLYYVDPDPVIRWLHRKPDDLDLKCFKKKKINLGSFQQDMG